MEKFKKFDLKKTETQLKKMCKLYNLPLTATECILSNMEIYNQMLDDIFEGEVKKVYFLPQLNGQIFNQLKEFKLTPPRKAIEVEEEEDKLTLLKKKLKTND